MTDAGLDPLDDYVRINRANWNSRVPVHATGYDLDRFRTEPDFLSGVVRFDVPRLGDVRGLDAVHLQCHIGTDTLSLARLGARMTGLDFSAPALDVGRQLAAACGTAIDYVCAEVYDAVEVLGGERFDLVYTGIGALCWLPDVRRWADVVAGLLRPGGRLFMREGHPMVWSLCDPRPDGLLVVEYPVLRDARHALHRAEDLRRARGRHRLAGFGGVQPRPRSDHHRTAGRGDDVHLPRGAHVAAVERRR